MPILLGIVTAPRGERKIASENTPTLTQVTPKTATPSNTGLLSDEAKEAFIMYANSCMSWEQFTYYESVSNSVCVYGEIVKIQTVVRSGYSDVTFFRFSSSAGHIMLAGDAFAFAELQPNIGECVRAMGFVYNIGALYSVSLGDGTWAKINNSYCD